MENADQKDIVLANQTKSEENLDKKKQKKEKKAEKKKRKLIRRISYLFVWAFFIAYLMGINIVSHIFEFLLPHQIFIEVEKHFYLVYLMIVAGALIYFRIPKMFLWLIELIFFPFLVLFVIIPKTSFKAISIISKGISEAISFSNSLKYKFLISVLFFSSSIIILDSSNKQLLTVSMIVLLIVLILHFIKRFFSISRPVYIFNKIQHYTFLVWEKVKTEAVLKKISKWKKLDPADDKYNKEKTETLKILWLINRLFYRFSNYLKKLKGNRIIVGYFVCAICFTLFFTIFTFTLEYFALIKLYPESFKGIDSPNFLDCLYFSFMTIFTLNFGDIVPQIGHARFLISIEILSGLTIGVLLFFIFTTITIERYKKELDDFISNLSKEEVMIKELIETEYEKRIKEIVPDVVESFQTKKKNEKVKEWLSLDDCE